MSGFTGVTGFAPPTSIAGFMGLLQTASFRGVPFKVIAAQAKKGRRQAIHEYPYVDGGWPEDMGRALRIYRFSGYLIGDLAPVMQLLLDNAVETKGPGLLIHPTIGAVKVAVGSASTAIHRDKMRVIEVAFQFIEAGSPVFPSTIIATVIAVLAAADSALTASGSDLGGTAIPAADGRPGRHRRGPDGGDQLRRGDDRRGRQPNGDRRHGSGAPAARCQYLLRPLWRGLGLDHAADRHHGCDAPGPTRESACRAGPGCVWSRRSRWLVFRQHRHARRPGGAGGGDAGRDHRSGRPGAGPARAGRVHLRGQRRRDGRASARRWRRCAMRWRRRAGVPRWSAWRAHRPAYQPSSYDDAAALRVVLAAALDSEITAAGDAGEDASYTALKALRSAVVQDLTVRGASLPSIVTVNLQLPLPSLVIAHRLYLDASRSDQIAAESGAIHPAFCPTTFQALASGTGPTVNPSYDLAAGASVPLIAPVPSVGVYQLPSPNAPLGLAVVSTTASTAVLSWSPATTGGLASGYIVQVSAHGAGIWSTAGTVGPSPTGFTVTGLSSNTAYDFQVLAQQRLGRWIPVDPGDGHHDAQPAERADQPRGVGRLAGL